MHNIKGHSTSNPCQFFCDARVMNHQTLKSIKYNTTCCLETQITFPFHTREILPWKRVNVIIRHYYFYCFVYAYLYTGCSVIIIPSLVCSDIVSMFNLTFFDLFIFFYKNCLYNFLYNILYQYLLYKYLRFSMMRNVIF